MEELLRTIFDAFPEKSTIIFKGKCSDCGGVVIIDIIATLEGFGLLGGAFVECSTDKYVAKCPDCYKFNSRDKRLQVLAGIIDSDGSYSKKDKCYEYPDTIDLKSPLYIYQIPPHHPKCKCKLEFE